MMDDNLFRGIVEEAPDPIFIETGGDFSYLNPAACRLLGIDTPEDLIGTPVTDRVHPDHHDIIYGHIRSLRDGSVSYVEPFDQRIIRADGSEVWVETSGKSIAYDGKKGGLFFMRDISSRKETEQTLRASEGKVQLALEANHIGIWELNASGESVYRSLTHDKIFGYDSILPHWSYETFLSHVHPDDRDHVNSTFTEANRTGQDWSFECRIFRSDGALRWIWAAGRFSDKNNVRGRSMSGVVQDITRIRLTEQEIKESEEKFRNVFHKHIAVKLIINPDTGKIIEANEAAARFYGWSVAELTSMNIAQINTLSPEEIREEMELARNLVNTHFNFKHRVSDGSIKDVEVYSSRITTRGKDFLHSIIHDVTEKKSTEKQLKLLSRSVEQSPVSIVITDTNGKIEYVNPGFQRISGYSLEEVKGQTPRFLKSGYHPPEFYKYLWKTILSGKDWTGELRNRKKNGELYWINAVISPILNSRGEVTNFVSIREDITGRKKMVQDLVAAKEKAEESDRLKLAFLANMSHEIRTPMNGILGFAEILKEPGLTSQKQHKFLEIIERSGKRMLDTVNDLIDISKIETGQVKLDESEINLKERLENLYEFFSPQAEDKNLQFTLKDSVPLEFAMVRTDRSKLDSILTNLIKNAIKFTEKGKIEVGCRQKEKYLEFYVTDTGIGVPPGRQAAIFNRFEQADTLQAKSFQGAGLGLAIAKAYVEMLGGEIRLESEEGQGSAFYFTLPLISAGALSDKLPERKTLKRTGIPYLGGKRILVAEDDFYSREMITHLLMKTEATLLVAGDGMGAVEEFQKGQHNIDLVLLDIQLPEMNGFEVLRILRAINPDLPVIAQTAYAMLEDIRKFREAGFTGYITKPISQENLYSILYRHLGVSVGDLPVREQENTG
jgi:PAS domain S-box-containing protein